MKRLLRVHSGLQRVLLNKLKFQLLIPTDECDWCIFPLVDKLADLSQVGLHLGAIHLPEASPSNASCLQVAGPLSRFYPR